MMEDSPAPLVGLAVGDSLGMGFETQSAFSASLLGWDGSFQGSDYHGLKPGQWTDDTMMARLLAESLASCGGFYPRDIADRYLLWYRSGPMNFRGMGKTTMEALSRLDRGTPWNESGVHGAEGNGTAMRVAPLGAFFAEDLATIFEFAAIEAKITHVSLEAETGSLAVALGVALLTRKEALPATLPAQVRSLLVEKGLSSKVIDGLKSVIELVEGDAGVSDALGLIGTGAHVVQTVPAAFAAFSMTHSYEEAVIAAVRAGGDTDTTAAIAGALAGAYYGASAIPKKLTSQLEDFKALRRIEKKIQGGPRPDMLWKM